MEFRGLRVEDDRSKFSCGQREIDHFFRKYAALNQFTHQIGVTHVLDDDGRIAAFVTVAATSVSLPAEFREDLPGYPLPAVLIARMGVDKEFQRRKLAERLLRECCRLAVQQAATVGCCGLTTDAKPGAIEFYRKYSFQPIAEPGENGTQLHFLGIRHFRALVEANVAGGGQ